MREYPKQIKRLIREYAARAYEAELGQALGELEQQFAGWRRGQISAGELSDRIYSFSYAERRRLASCRPVALGFFMTSLKNWERGCSMGMFDNLRVESPLPDPEYQERIFQTKSLECCLSDYTITREGRLVVREVEWEATPEKEMPYYDTPEWEQGGLARICGMPREKSSREVVLDDFHIATTPSEWDDMLDLKARHHKVLWAEAIATAMTCGGADAEFNIGRDVSALHGINSAAAVNHGRRRLSTPALCAPYRGDRRP